MKNVILCYFLAVCCFSACRTAVCGTVKQVPAPFVILRNGDSVNTEHADYNFYREKTGHIGKLTIYSELYRPRIVVDDTSFKFRDVAAFGDGNRSFVDVGNGNFAFQCGDGKINLFARVYTHSGFLNAVHRSQQTFDLTADLGGPGTKCVSNIPVMGRKGHTVYPRARFYVRQAGQGVVERFRYQSLVNMIPTVTHSYFYLVKFRRTKVIAPIVFAGGMALFFSGIGTAGMAHGNTTADKRNATNGSLMGYPGFALSLGSLYVYCTNKYKLRKAFETFNLE